MFKIFVAVDKHQGFNRPFLQSCAMKQNVENKPVWCCIRSHLNAWKCATNFSAGSGSKSGNME